MTLNKYVRSWNSNFEALEGVKSIITAISSSSSQNVSRITFQRTVYKSKRYIWKLLALGGNTLHRKF